MKTKKGQIGPFSLDVLFPLIIAIIVMSLFVAYMLTLTKNQLEQRSVESTHDAALNLLEVLADGSVLLHANTPGLLDNSLLSCDNVKKYPLTGYNYTVEVYDLKEKKTMLKCGTDPGDITAPLIATPIAIFYERDKIHSGLIKVQAWRKR
ncbi:MAG: hypothetical protein WAX07_04820 [Candidatus Altiarchaeia archaeon]